MKRKFLMVLLAAGAVVGFAKGFAHMHAHYHHRQAAAEQHMADICAEAAVRATAEQTRPDPVEPAQPSFFETGDER